MELEPKTDLEEVRLAEIIDVAEVQSMLDDLYKLTKISMGIVDLKGELLVANVFQEICTRFHRAHPETSRHCRESDTQLSEGVGPGAFKFYKCRNHLWDVVTPIMVKGRHLGNLLVGQFFFDDEEPDRKLFREQARRYGFDEQEYLAALDRVPRLSRETVDTALVFFSRLAEMIARLSYNNLELARAFDNHERLFKSLQESEAKFSRIFRLTPAPVGINQIPDGVFLDVNEAFERFTGYSREEAIGKSSVALGVWVDARDREELVRLVRERGEVHNREVALRRKDGRIAAALFSATPIEIQGKQVLLTIASDITERKQAEEALRIQATILEQLSEGVAYTSLDGTVAFSNRAFATMHGYEPHELLGKHLSVFHTPDQMPAVDAANEALKAQGEWSGEIWHCRRDGSVFPAMMHNVVLRGAKNAAIGIVATMSDATELRQAMEGLRQSEAKFRMLFEGANDAIFLMKDERFVDCNSRTLEMYGCTRDQILGQPPYRFSPPRQYDGRDSREKAEEKMRAAMAGEPQRFEWLHCRYDGTPFDAEVSLNRMQVEGAWGLQAIVRDITERKKAERLVQEALAEKEALLREVHHRVKNNLQVIVSLLEVEAGNIADPELRRAIGAIQTRALTMATVHQHLCASEKLSQVELSSYLEKLVHMLRASLQSACPVEVGVEAEGVLLPMDAALVVGLIVNELITNAFKYAFPACPEGGCRIAIRLKRDGGHCELMVGDNGVGLPEGFDPKRARSQGLRLVEVLARQMKAEVKIAPRPGTTFTFRFRAESA